ncbi:M24 family metallopeptidase, partial [Halogeometricum sp. CBA1124]|uniref:M24 family metallopeptidase n=1 Tax=Halogeometricum sp. CBA1124 TaxID=2668071 RepID=UPI0031B6B00D
NAWPKHQANTTDRLIRPGDLVYADFYNIGYLGYRSCYYRTFSVGEPTDAQSLRRSVRAPERRASASPAPETTTARSVDARTPAATSNRTSAETRLCIASTSPGETDCGSTESASRPSSSRRRAPRRPSAATRATRPSRRGRVGRGRRRTVRSRGGTRGGPTPTAP